MEAETVFRSRLEERIAACMSLMGLAWEYEPRAFALPDGRYYVPDFWLPETRQWVEVKGDHGERLDKTLALAEMLLVQGNYIRDAWGNELAIVSCSRCYRCTFSSNFCAICNEPAEHMFEIAPLRQTTRRGYRV